MMDSIYVVGGEHGEYDKLVRLLKDAGLADDRLHWSGRDTTLWFLGDFVDRGPDGIGVVDLVMRLQVEAEEAGGKVWALLGNHEPVSLSALWLPDQPCGGPGGTFYSNWKLNGGIDTDPGGNYELRITEQ